MRGSWRAELVSLLRLAAPLVFVQFNSQLTSFVDTALAGRDGEMTLAAAGLGSTVFFTASVVGLGCGFGLDPFVSQALGADQPRAARGWLWQGIYLSLAVSVPLWGLAWALALALPAMGVEAQLAAAAQDFLLGRLPSLPPFCLVAVLRTYLQANHVTRPVVVSAVVMNLFNFGVDCLLLWGDAALLAVGLPAVGLPAFGVLGLGVASSLATLLQAAMLAYAVSQVRVGSLAVGADRVGVLHHPQRARLLRLARVGLPAGLQLLAEVGIFGLVGILMGGMGARTMAAHQTALQLASMSFSMCLGTGLATAVQVGRAVGRNDGAAARRVGILGVGVGVGFMLLSALAMWLIPEALVGLLSRDPMIFEAAVPLLGVAAFFQIADGAQAVATGALRGAGVTRWSFVANVLGHWGLGVPMACLLTYHLGWGPRGLWWGLTVGLTAVALALCSHFWSVSSRPLRRLEA